MLTITELNDYIANMSSQTMPIFAYVVGIIVVFYIADHLIFFIKTQINQVK